MSSSAEAAVDMNRTIAKAEAIHLERQILALQTLYPTQGYTIKRVAGSTTILSPAMLGRKLNHTYGFALQGEVTMDDLHAIEAAYKQNSVHPEIDMCDFADSSAFDLLSAQYTVTGSLCEYQRSRNLVQKITTHSSKRLWTASVALVVHQSS